MVLSLPVLNKGILHFCLKYLDSFIKYCLYPVTQRPFLCFPWAKMLFGNQMLDQQNWTVQSLSTHQKSTDLCMYLCMFDFPWTDSQTDRQADRQACLSLKLLIVITISTVNISKIVERVKQNVNKYPGKSVNIKQRLRFILSCTVPRNYLLKLLMWKPVSNCNEILWNSWMLFRKQ